MTSRISKKPQDGQESIRTIEPTPNTPSLHEHTTNTLHSTTPTQSTKSRQTRKPVTELAAADEDLLFRERLHELLLYGEPDTHIESLWLIFAIPIYCCVGAILVCLVTIYVSMFAGVLTSWISLIGALIGWKRLNDHGDKDDAAFLLLWGSWITFMASGAGLGTITDNKLNLSDPAVRNVYVAAEAFGCIVLGSLAAAIRVVRKRHRK